MDEPEQRPKVLIVDDVPENIQILGAALPQYTLVFATSGTRALEIAMSDDPPDVVLLDILMPGMDGYEVIRRLKDDPRTAGIPVIFVTTVTELSSEVRGLELGAVDYITKPIQPRLVQARVETHVNLKRAREAIARQNELLEQKVAERTRQLEESTKRLIESEKMVTLGRMASGFVHEIRNYLNPFFLAHCEDLEGMLEGVAEARSGILELLNEIRALAYGEEVTYTLTRQPVSHLLERVLRFVRCDKRVRRAKLEYDCEEGIAVPMDGDRMRQVLINLIQNAADAVSGVEDPTISIAVRKQGEDACCISVADNGCGIPPDLRDRVYEPFFSTKGEMSLGVGLDVCRRIVQAHGGMLRFESRDNGGTMFEIRLPLDSERGADSART